MATTEGSGSPVRLGVSPLSWTNDVLAELGGDTPLEVCLQEAAEIGYEIDLEPYAAKLGEFSVGLSKRGIKLAYHYHLKMLVETGAEIATFCQATLPEVGLLLD